MNSSLVNRIPELTSSTLQGLSSRIYNLNTAYLQPKSIPTILGYSTLTYLLYKASIKLRYNLHSSKIQRYHHPHRKTGNTAVWALVTGASSGIGLEFVHALASRAFNIILHGRNETKLASIIKGLKTKYPERSFQPLVLDCQSPTDDAFDASVLSSVAGRNLTLVIHNVGAPAPGFKELAWQVDMHSDEINGWIDINARFATHLTRLLLPGLVANQPALMLFLSSAATVTPVPRLALYSAAKLFVESYATTLRLEMKTMKADVEVKALIVGTVATATSGRSDKDRSATMPLTKEFVDACLGTVGWDEAVVIPWWGHQLQLGLMSLMPLWLYELFIGALLKQVEAGFEKAERDKEEMRRKEKEAEKA